MYWLIRKGQTRWEASKEVLSQKDLTEVAEKDLLVYEENEGIYKMLRVVEDAGGGYAIDNWLEVDAPTIAPKEASTTRSVVAPAAGKSSSSK